MYLHTHPLVIFLFLFRKVPADNKSDHPYNTQMIYESFVLYVMKVRNSPHVPPSATPTQECAGEEPQTHYQPLEQRPELTRMLHRPTLNC